jgi:hypothetical protein
MIGENLMLSADLRVRALVRTIIWSLLALVAAIGALSFFGAALWLWIDGHLGPVAASFILGIAFLSVTAVSLFKASMSRLRYPLPRPKVGVDDLAEAFFAAVEVGRTARRRR